MLAAEPISERFSYRPPSFGTVSRGLPVAREKCSLVQRDLFAIGDMFRPPRGKPASWRVPWGRFMVLSGGKALVGSVAYPSVSN
ncbi:MULTISPECIES: hypothetical protein [Nitrosomonas]|uniref:Uncharacterized protein n=1 Tax=Nitrosomonas communis TaxID=44574 RepID=A0A5D3Y7P7_9PROT|nr:MULTISPECIES: hypothetical protein [Nitrosomonas]TYP78358.1 hypothetical protein BCL69_107511 [Nitrosomonas communis]UVS62896.1 hypothetical protein NX761_07285 [Nitrosomonas sp. PLL12]